MSDLWQNKVRISIHVDGNVAEYGHMLTPDMIESLRAVRRKREVACITASCDSYLAFKDLDEAIKKRDMVISNLSTAISHALITYFEGDQQ